MLSNTNRYKCLYFCDEDEDEDEEVVVEYSNTFRHVVTFKDKVNLLYDYFLHKGENSNTSYNWRIEKCQIIAALRRNNNDYTKAAEDLERLLENMEFDIRQFYIDNGLTKIFPTSEYKSRPYLHGQDWQKNMKVGTYLLFKNNVYQIMDYSYDYGCITLSHLLSKNYFTIYINNYHLITGKFIEIKDKNCVDIEFEREFKEIKRNYEDSKEMSRKSLIICRKKISECLKQRIKLEYEHYRLCCPKPKLDVLIFMKLPVEILKLIASYGLQNTDCEHLIDIINEQKAEDYYKEELIDLRLHMKNECYKYEVAENIFNGTYDEWIGSDYYEWPDDN